MQEFSFFCAKELTWRNFEIDDIDKFKFLIEYGSLFSNTVVIKLHDGR